MKGTEVKKDKYDFAGNAPKPQSGGWGDKKGFGGDLFR